jgi:anaerobic selenocysteine-containing dehydrogenase
VRAAGLARYKPRGLLARDLKQGPYADRLSMSALEGAPHGIDLGALAPCLPQRLRTEDKLMRLAPPALVADIARLERALDAAPAHDGHLELIGRRELRSNNSWMHNSERLVRGKRMCTLLMHPDDAATRGLADGARVRVSSRTGAVEVELETSDAMMPGVVCLPHGWGHDRPGVQLSVARAHGGVSINDLTDDARIDVLTGNAGFSGVAVEVRGP